MSRFNVLSWVGLFLSYHTTHIVSLSLLQYIVSRLIYICPDLSLINNKLQKKERGKWSLFLPRHGRTVDTTSIRLRRGVGPSKIGHGSLQIGVAQVAPFNPVILEQTRRGGNAVEDAVEGVVVGEERDVLRGLTLGPPSVPVMSPKWKTIPKYLLQMAQIQVLAMNLYSKRSRNVNDIIKR